jgi:hypothetical protein
LLLDGLDEVADEEAYNSVAAKINDLRQLWPEARAVVTCRKAGWRGGLHDAFRAFTVLPLDSQQQYDFTHKWYGAILGYVAYGAQRSREDIESRAGREANKLLSLIRTKDRLREVSSNPLILSLICLVHHRKKDLPRGRPALYGECVDILLDLWDRIDKDLDQVFPTMAQKQLILRRIAYHMHTSGIREVARSKLAELVLRFLPEARTIEAADDIVRQIEVRSGLMVERSIDILTFSHLTFQEFFIVIYFRDEIGASFAVERIENWAAWREPVLLMCGTEKEPAPLLLGLYRTQPLLALMGICEVDPIHIDSELREMVQSVVARCRTREFDLNDALPCLIELFSIAGNPFGPIIEEFIFGLIASVSASEISSLVESLSKIPTQEAARILLTLLEKQGMNRYEETVLSGVARIGDAGVQEALDFRTAERLTENRLLRIIAACESPFAATVLWRRYGLTPPPDYEFEWALAWAQRLAGPEAEFLRQPVPARAGVHDELRWPYRAHDPSICAAIVVTAITVFESHYPSIWDLLADVSRVSGLSLRILVPLLVTRADGPDDRQKEVTDRFVAEHPSADFKTVVQEAFNIREVYPVSGHMDLDSSLAE